MTTRIHHFGHFKTTEKKSKQQQDNWRVSGDPPLRQVCVCT